MRVTRRLILAGLLLLAAPSEMGAQQLPASTGRAIVTGTVISKADGAAVSGATIVAGPSRETTDTRGTFRLAAEPGRLRLLVSAAGFLDQAIDIVVTAGMPPLEVALVRALVREDVTVLAEGPSQISVPAALAVAPSSVLRVAGAADNVFKAIQTLPGISATDDFGSRLAVRGGGPDQNLTVMDGVEIHNPYRLFGLTSAFNPEIVDRFELTAGGFGVEYGDRLSSILLVENRAGTSRERFAGSASLSLTDANIVFEGALPQGARGSWLLTGRRTYYDLVADRITGNDLPSFGDVQAKGVWELRPGHALTLFGLRSRERTDAEFTDAGDRIAVGDVSSNDVVSVAYRALLGPRAASRTTVAWYDYGDDLGVDGTLRDGARRTNSPGQSAQQQSRIVFTRSLGVRDFSVRQQIDVQAGRRHFLGAGFDAHVLRTTWGWTIEGDRNSSVANGSSVLGGTGLPSLLASRRDTTRAAAWLQDRIQAGRRVRLEPGVRIDRSGLSDEVVVSPRLSIDVEVASGTRLKGSVGRFTQSPGYEKLLQSDYFVDLTSDAASSLTSERSTHVIATVERAVTPSVTARVEAYSKRFDRLIVGRLETSEETAARVARYDFPPALARDVPTAPEITSVPVNGARGHAFGFDVYVEKRQRTATDRLSGWASYTWGRATLDAYGVRRPFDYDRRHALSVVSTVGLGRRLDFASTLRIASGFPATTPVGVRAASAEAEDGSGRLVPAVDESGLTVWTLDLGDVSNLARGRLPLYARLDVRLTFKPRNPAGRWQVYFEVLNVLNRDNVSTLESELAFDPSSDRPSVTYATDSGLPLLPSFGVRYRF